MHNINLSQLRYVLVAAEHGSFRRAGFALRVRESAISRRIRDLEDALGASLFHRHSGGVHLTLAGERFLRRVRIALQHLDDAANEVAAIGRSEEGLIRVGIFSSLASGFLFELLQTHDRQYSGISVELINGDPADHIAAVRQLRIDIAFITGTARYSDCETENLWSERVFVVLPTNHRLASKNLLSWDDLADEVFIVSEEAPGPEIRDYLIQRLANLGHHPDVQPQYVGRDVLLSMVAIGRGLTLTSEATTAALFPGIVYKPVANEVLPFSAVWSPKNDNPAARRLLSLARSLSGATREATINGTLEGQSPSWPSQIHGLSQ